MVIVMQEGATDEQIQHVIDRIVASGFDVHRSTGASHTVLGAVGVHRDFDHRDFELLEGVREVIRITQPFKLASRAFKPQGTIVDLGRGVTIGGQEIAVAAGPCSVESTDQIQAVAEAVSKAGARILRAGAFKPRTSPYAFQGLGEKGLKLMRDAADKNQLFVVSEVMDPSQIQMMSGYVDIFQVGARNMQNYFLLRALGEVQKPVPSRSSFLARNTSSPVEITTWFFASAGFARSKLISATRWTSPRFQSSRSFRTCLSLRILHTGPDAVTRCLPWLALRLLPELTAFSLRCTTIPSTRFPMAPNRSRRANSLN